MAKAEISERYSSITSAHSFILERCFKKSEQSIDPMDELTYIIPNLKDFDKEEQAEWRGNTTIFDTHATSHFFVCLYAIIVNAILLVAFIDASTDA